MNSTGARERSYKCPCPGCPRVYASKYNLRRHTTYSHPHYHQFQCETCGKVLSTKQNYKQHQLIHTGSRPFVCRMCRSSFRQSTQLTYHLREHLAAARLVPVPKVRPTQLTALLPFTSDHFFNPASPPLWSLPPSEVLSLPNIQKTSQEYTSLHPFTLNLPISQA